MRRLATGFSMTGPLADPEVSVVMPVVQTGTAADAVYLQFASELERLERSHEFVFVIGGYDHPELDRLTARARSATNVSILVISEKLSEAEALKIGFARARGKVFVTLASYFQVQPSSISRMFEKLDLEGADMVVARRFPRSDGLLPRLQSALFHLLVRSLTSTRFRDISCGLRMMKREVAMQLELYGDFHRFLPVLADQRGFLVQEANVEHHPSDRPPAVYGPAAYVRRLLDTLTMFFLVRFTRRPLRFFGLVGTPSLVLGMSLTLYLVIYRVLGLGAIGDRPLLVIGILLLVLGVQSLSIGLLGELIIFTSGGGSREYRVAEVAGQKPEPSAPVDSDLLKAE